MAIVDIANRNIAKIDRSLKSVPEVNINLLEERLLVVDIM